MSSLLSVEDVSLAFGGLKALDGVSLEVAAGSVTGLIGPNGAGKTTLFNVISGLQRADGGVIRFEDRDVTRWSASRRAALGIGRSFQNLGLIDDETLGTNLLAAQFVGARYRSADVLVRPWRWRADERRMAHRAVEAAELFGLGDALDRRVRDLSFGKARFGELACVLLEQPRLLMLDEPTTGLDQGEVRRLLHVLRGERERGTTVLVVAHDVRFVMDLCDHVYVLTSGRLLADGLPAEIQRNPEVVAAYLGSAA